MEAIADAATDLVLEYGGSVSGEHGDGRARTQWNRKLYGDHVWDLFGDLKTAFDPDWLLNPGQVCGDVDMTEHLRYDADYEFEAGLDPELRWDNDNGFQGMVELCHGCGGCRGHQDTTGGVMCPTYRASEEESTATRGRANALRQAMSGDLPEDPTSEAFTTEIMDLCIGCKGCARDCPSEVDMAKLKAEVQHANHQENGAGLRDRLFADVDRPSKVGSALAPVSNWLASLPGSDVVVETFIGIARERDLPTFQRESFVEWYADRGPAVPADEAARKVVLFPDTYHNYSDPAVLKAAVDVLEAARVHVRVPANLQASGRAAHSKGFLDKSASARATTRRHFAPLVGDEWDLVAVEPSDAVMFQSDYLDLLATPEVETVAANAYGLCEFLSWFGLDETVDWNPSAESLTYHGHRHQKATRKDHYAVGVLRRAGYDVDALDSGCCGMAGSFGYEAEHYSMSQSIARILFDQIDESAGDRVVAPGASCRTQLGDRPGAEAPPTRSNDSPLPWRCDESSLSDSHSAFIASSADIPPDDSLGRRRSRRSPVCQRRCGSCTGCVGRRGPRASGRRKGSPRRCSPSRCTKNGSAQWTFEYSRPLENDSERADFEAFAEEFEANESAMYRDFVDRSTKLTAAGSESTGREMNASSFSRSASVDETTLADERGVVAMSFTWSNFGVTDGAAVRAGDVFEGGLYIGQNQQPCSRRGHRSPSETPTPAPTRRRATPWNRATPSPGSVNSSSPTGARA